MLFTVLMFVILLSVVVLFHEFGHYIVGKFFKFGIDAFAVGFGRSIFKIKKGETEYRFNWLPFGGYVKFVGEMTDEDVPEEDRDRAFSLRPGYQKAAVVFAGPFMNVVLAFLIFSIMFIIGFPTATTRIGYVAPDSPAQQAGLVPGDRIIEVEGEKIWRWDRLSEVIEEHPDTPIQIGIERDGDTIYETITPRLAEKRNIFNLPEQKGVIGIGENGMRPLVGIPDPDSIAAKAGLISGMQIIQIDQKRIFFKETLGRYLKDGTGHTLIAVENFEETEDKWHKKIIQLPAAEGTGMGAYGIEYADLYIYKVVEESPAAKAGLEPLDKLVAVDGLPIENWENFTTTVHDSSNLELTITVLRNGSELNLNVVPELHKEKDLMGEAHAYGRIGIVRAAAYEPAETAPERYLNPIKILQRGAELSVYWTVVTLKAFVLIFTGDVSPKAVGGPITIAVMAGETAKLGMFPFFLLMAIISLNLAVVNLIPVPIFDGGHLMFYLVEMIRRKPTNRAVLDIAMRIGVAMLAVLVVLIIYNDLSRFSYNIKALFVKMVNF